MSGGLTPGRVSAWGAALSALVPAALIGFECLVLGNQLAIGAQIAAGMAVASAGVVATRLLAEAMRARAAAVGRVAAAVDDLLASSRVLAQQTDAVATLGEAVARSGSLGLDTAREASAGLEAIREQTETVAETVIALSERTQAVGEIVATVNDIAEQSNLVALNAAIEAADAREHGRRFSVVANEIKTLADQAREAAGQVRRLLEQTQQGITTSVMLTDEALKRVEAGRERAGRSEQALHRLSGPLQENLDAVRQAAAAAADQRTGLEQLAQALRSLDDVRP